MSKMTTITLEVRPEDVEPILRDAAYEAALNSALCDYMTNKTWYAPIWGRQSVAQCKKEWQARFLRAKRLVEAFGVEYEQTSEPETMTVAFDHVGGKTRVINVDGIGPVGWKSGGDYDYKRPHPAYYKGVHAEACRQAADRVVRRWRAQLEATPAAASAAA